MRDSGGAGKDGQVVVIPGFSRSALASRLQLGTLGDMAVAETTPPDQDGAPVKEAAERNVSAGKLDCIRFLATLRVWG
jgi:hypothetical protein